MKDLFPRSDGQKMPWLDAYKENLPTVATEVGVDAAQVTLTQQKIESFRTGWNELKALRNAVQSKTATVRQEEKELLKFLRRQIGQIKKHSGYRSEIGEKLDVIIRQAAWVPNTFKPKIRVFVLPGEVRVEFGKERTDGVNVYCRLKGEAAFHLLGRDTNSPYLDLRPLSNPGVPEIREYTARAVVKDKEIGHMSDIVTVTFAG